jgi:hypothetical protein
VCPRRTMTDDRRSSLDRAVVAIPYRFGRPQRLTGGPRQAALQIWPPACARAEWAGHAPGSAQIWQIRPDAVFFRYSVNFFFSNDLQLAKFIGK